MSETSEPKNIIIIFKFRLDRKTKLWKDFGMVIEGISLINAKQAQVTARIRSSDIQTPTLEIDKSESQFLHNFKG